MFGIACNYLLYVIACAAVCEERPRQPRWRGRRDESEGRRLWVLIQHNGFAH